MEEEEQSFPQTIDDVYDFKSVLEKGGQGAVCLYKHRQTKEKVAVKFELSSKEISVLHESILLKKLKENETLTRIPRYISHDSASRNQYLIMEYLEQSVNEYLSKYQGPELEIAMCDVFIQMLEALEQLHSTFNIHRDVKPDNFRVKDGRVYLIDFGVSFEYLKNGQHIQLSTGQAFKGTLHFASINCNEKYTQSRRDDLEGLGYTILFFLTQGNIDFMQYENKETITSLKTHLEFARLKRNFIENDRISPQLQQIQEYLRCVRQLKFEENPNYQELKDILSYRPIIEETKPDMAPLTEIIQEQVILKPVNQDQFEEQKEFDYGGLQNTEIAIAYENMITEALIHLQKKEAKKAIYTFKQLQITTERAFQWKVFQMWWWRSMKIWNIFRQREFQVFCSYCKTQISMDEANKWTTDDSINCQFCFKLIRIYLGNEQDDLEAGLSKEFPKTDNKIEDEQEFVKLIIKKNLENGTLMDNTQLAQREEDNQQRMIVDQPEYIGQGMKFDKEQLKQFMNLVSKIENYKPFEYTYFDFTLNEKSLKGFNDSLKVYWILSSANNSSEEIESIRVYLYPEKKEYQMVKDNQNSWVLKMFFNEGQEHYFYYTITTKDQQEHNYLNPNWETCDLHCRKYNFF